MSKTLALAAVAALVGTLSMTEPQAAPPVANESDQALAGVPVRPEPPPRLQMGGGRRREEFRVRMFAASGHEADLPGFPTPDELWALTFAEVNLWRNRFAAIPFEDKGGTWQGRYYQDIAVARVLDAITAGRDRILLTLATGTGKTFIAFQLAWKLFQSRWNLADWRRTPQLSTPPSRRPRVLFLADRNNLADQAYNAFSAFADDALVRIEPGFGRREDGRM